MTTPLLAVDCVGKRYGERRVLTSASLRATEGEIRALVGRNGCGKSTLIAIAAGRLVADTGMVRWDETPLHEEGLHDVAARGLFYLPDRDLLSNAFTVRHQLSMLHEKYGGMTPTAAAARMGIETKLDGRPGALSGGERRRAELAAVFVRAPRCLLADEPFRGLAPLDAERLVEAFRSLASAGVAVVITGHELPTMLAVADHVTWCTSGTTYELGHPTRAVEHDAFRLDYLGAGRA